MIKTKYKITIYTLIASIFILVFSLSLKQVNALTEKDFRIYLDEATVMERGYTIDKPDGKMRMAIHPTVLPSPALITLKKAENQSIPTPKNLIRVSEILEFDILTDPIKIFDREVVIVQSYNSPNQYTKKIYFWDDNSKSWRPLYSLTNYNDQWIRAYTHLPYSKIAVFEDRNSVEGYASWYRSYTYSHGAASNDYPLGTRLNVTNLETGANTTVEVVSTGPYDGNRVLDLTHQAFQELATLGTGLVKVHITPADGQVLGEKTGPSETGIPSIIGAAGIVIDNDNKVLFDKNSVQSRSIASITKVVSALVYLNTNPNLSGSATVAAQDNAEGVRIAVNPGDSMSIRDLFHASLTGSANNATKALARSTGLTLGQFVYRMNAQARKIGMNNYNFIEPTGLESENRASAEDVAKLINYAMKNPLIRSATLEHSFTYAVDRVGGNRELRTIKNPIHIYSNNLTDEPLNGGKTGYINEAGWCLAVSFKADSGRFYTAVTLGSNQAGRNQDIEKLIHYYKGK
ncbi:RlpA-like double-psi beta-barrel domain-containing protein [Patescibacteria group bacterium]